MNPGGGFRGLTEVLYLAFWWAAWSLADFYLLDVSPWSELAVLIALGVAACVWWVYHHTAATRSRTSAVELKEQS